MLICLSFAAVVLPVIATATTNETEPSAECCHRAPRPSSKSSAKANLMNAPQLLINNIVSAASSAVSSVISASSPTSLHCNGVARPSSKSSGDKQQQQQQQQQQGHIQHGYVSPHHQHHRLTPPFLMRPADAHLHPKSPSRSPSLMYIHQQPQHQQQQQQQQMIASSCKNNNYQHQQHGACHYQHGYQAAPHVYYPHPHQHHHQQPTTVIFRSADPYQQMAQAQATTPVNPAAAAMMFASKSPMRYSNHRNSSAFN